MKTITYVLIGFAILTPALASACISAWGNEYGMMGHGGVGMGTFMFVGGTTWTVVGILAGVWLWQNINKK